MHCGRTVKAVGIGLLTEWTMYITGGGARGDDIRKARLHYELVGDGP